MNIRLSVHDRKQLAAALKADIDAYCVATFEEGYRSHLGISTIGETCLRRIVYSWRWMHREQFDGRMLRLFNRGHKEEFRFVEWLKGIEAQVWELGEGGKQHRVTAIHGHYGGSLDGIMKLPPKYNLDIPFLLEMKTHNDKSFKKLVKMGVQQAKPEHYVQMCGYGEDYKFDYALYIAVNKNDDDLYLDIVELQHKVGVDARTKALAVCGSVTLPPKIAASPAYDTCKYCPMAGVCHNNEPIDVNCRSCTNASPVEDGRWYCEKWGANIPAEAIPLACGEWKAFT